MSSIFEHFGIGSDLFETEGEFKSLSEDHRPSKLSDIRDAINLTVPRECGHELIRIGSDGGGRNPAILDDGKYLMPDDLDGIEACFSPGVADTKGFEDELAERFGIKSFMCDFSSEEGRFATPIIPEMQFFRKKWLDTSGDDDSITIEQWVSEESAGTNDLLLQMDIEGAEYRNIISCKGETLERFRIIVIEVHGLGFLERMDFLNGIFIPFIKKITRSFTCVHAHPNNNAGLWTASEDLVIPRLMELTFLRNDRFTDKEVRVEIPHPLDIVNNNLKPPVFLSEPWARFPRSNDSKLLMFEQRLKWAEKELARLSNELDERE